MEECRKVCRKSAGSCRKAARSCRKAARSCRKDCRKDVTFAFLQLLAL